MFGDGWFGVPFPLQHWRLPLSVDCTVFDRVSSSENSALGGLRLKVKSGHPVNAYRAGRTLLSVTDGRPCRNAAAAASFAAQGGRPATGGMGADDGISLVRDAVPPGWRCVRGRNGDRDSVGGVGHGSFSAGRPGVVVQGG
jgi:hypothetical protein